ncbi:MAG TPA: hypothetical protein VES89_09485 [Candidatus Competibacteraceae bacterium]|nr:hypothetical protein [Candidatus Competibacteraceae bacterium]
MGLSLAPPSARPLWPYLARAGSLRYRFPGGLPARQRPPRMKATVQRLTHGISMGFQVDQRVDSGDWIPFFGRESLTTSSPARLALKFNCPLIPLQVERLQGAHFRLTIHPPLTPEDPQADPATQARQLTRHSTPCSRVGFGNIPSNGYAPSVAGLKGPKPLGPVALR